ncbi:MAG TPA: LytTR family DNA-binding domain-containing protein [Bacteroidota bacterium]|nr:LytTR family DNA-binding domain-containing protein [Bacteroidota bacterium]
MHMRAMLVDDEELARKRLRKLLQKHGAEIEIVGEADNGTAAAELIARERPDVVFLDVQMPGCDGFEVVRRLQAKPVIIFVTAYNEYALKAFEENSIDYLLKPVTQERLDKTIEKMHRFFESSSDEMNERLHRFLTHLASPQIRRLKVNLGEKIILLDLPDIVYIEAKDKYTFVHTQDSEYMIDESLSDIHARLEDANFIRIHRAYIVNIKYVRELVKWFAGRYKVRLKDKAGTELVVTRNYADQIRRL